MENKSTGYIAIFRSLKTHWLWEDPTKLKWWLDILLSVNYSDQKVLIKSTLIECKRGQSIRSLETWATGWRTTKKTVQTFFKILQSDGMIQVENLKTTTRLTVCNYDSYNSSVNGSDHDMETLPTPRRKRNLHPNNKGNNDNNENNDNNKFVPPSLYDVRCYFYENGYKDESAVTAFNHYDVADWHDSKGTKVKNWKQKMQSVWFKPENKIQSTQSRFVI